MKISYVVMCCIVAVLAFGCVKKNPQLYSWGDYSNSLYAYKKSPSDETYAAHKNQLLNIISNSKEEMKQVPPGVFAELCYFLGNEGKIAEAKSNCEFEKQLYPESTYFIDKLERSIEMVKNRFPRGCL